MAYVLVMGGLALSVCFTLGWVLVRGGQWLWRRRPGAGASRTASARRQRPTPKPKPKPKSRQAARPKAKPPSEPWGLTRWLARRRSALPLAVLAVLLYGFARLAAYGMAHRPQDAPGAFHELVAGLGWLAAGLLVLALISLLAQWRCRGE